MDWKETLVIGFLALAGAWTFKACMDQNDTQVRIANCMKAGKHTAAECREAFGHQMVDDDFNKVFDEIKNKGYTPSKLIISSDQHTLLRKILEIDPNFSPTVGAHINLRANELGVKL